jgi:hypothetical protein
MQANVQTTMTSKYERDLNVMKEATRGWLEMVGAIEITEKRHENEMGEEMGDLRRLMTRNYNALVKEIEENKEVDEARHAEIAKKWIRDNLEEAQQIIDNIVGIKGITENPLKAAIEAGIVYETPLPRVSISSSIVPSNEELYGY